MTPDQGAVGKMDETVTQTRVHELEGRVTRMEAGIESLTISVGELTRTVREEAASRRTSFDDLVNRLDAKTRPQHSLILQMIGIGVTLAIVMGGLIGAWFSRSETENLRWRTNVEGRLVREASAYEQRVIRLDETVQREMRLLDDSIQKETRTLDAQLAERLKDLEDSEKDIQRWRSLRDAASIESNTQQGERITALQRQVDVITNQFGIEQASHNQQLSDRQAWMRQLEARMGMLVQKVEDMGEKLKNLNRTPHP